MNAGRPDTFTPELAEILARRVAGGESWVRICADEDMPGMHMVARWLKRHPGFLEFYHPDAVAQRANDPVRLVHRMR